MPNPPSRPLDGVRIAITRPVGTGRKLARSVRKLGGTPLLLPGSSLRAPPDAEAARTALRRALAAEVVIFTSPAAVRFAERLMGLHGTARALAPGRGTAAALRRAGVGEVTAPDREDSEGLLALPALRKARGRLVGVIGAAGGRGLLERTLALRGARVTLAHVYERVPARLDRRHAAALLRVRKRPLFVLLSSTRALGNVVEALPPDARQALMHGTAVVSSERLVDAAGAAGFAHVLRAASTHARDLLAAVVNTGSREGSLLACPHE